MATERKLKKIKKKGVKNPSEKKKPEFRKNGKKVTGNLPRFFRGFSGIFVSRKNTENQRLQPRTPLFWKNPKMTISGISGNSGKFSPGIFPSRVFLDKFSSQFL